MVGVALAKIRQLPLDVVVRVGEGFDDESHGLVAGERLHPGGEERIHPLAREAR